MVSKRGKWINVFDYKISRFTALKQGCLHYRRNERDINDLSWLDECHNPMLVEIYYFAMIADNFCEIHFRKIDYQSVECGKIIIFNDAKISLPYRTLAGLYPASMVNEVLVDVTDMELVKKFKRFVRLAVKHSLNSTAMVNKRKELSDLLPTVFDDFNRKQKDRGLYDKEITSYLNGSNGE